MKGIKSKIFNYIFFVIGFLLTLREGNAKIKTGKNTRNIADVSIMSIEPVELSFVVICKGTRGNLKKKCEVFKEYIFDSDSMDRYSSNLIRELEATDEMVVTGSEYRFVHNDLTLTAYNNKYRHVLPENHGIIEMTPFQQLSVQKRKVFDTSKRFQASRIFSLRFNMKDYNLLNLKVKNGDNENLINWFKDNYVFNDRYNLLNSRDVQCNDDIFQAEGAWGNYRANMEINVGLNIDNDSYFNDPNCAVGSDVDVYEVWINYSYTGSEIRDFYIICAINGACHINLADNEYFIPQLTFGKNNNFRICLTEDKIKFITCDRFNLLVFNRTSNT